MEILIFIILVILALTAAFGLIIFHDIKIEHVACINEKENTFEKTVLDDEAIIKPEDDEFERTQYANDFANRLCLPSGSSSIVFAIEDAWGMGKSSVISLIKNELLKSDHITLDLAVKNREETIDEMVKLLANSSAISNPEQTKKMVIEREHEVGTGIGYGVAIPHTEPGPFEQPCAALARLKKGVNFQAPDGGTARLIFLLLTPDRMPALHVRLLARICRLMKSSRLRELLLKAATIEEAYNAIAEAEEDFPELIP